jgi:transposase
MQTVSTIGLDIAKSVLQVHGVDAAGQVIVRRQLKRRYVLAFFQKLPPCLVGIEACASSHHWSRELQALGHTVRLMPPAYVKPYVKRHKNDATDAEAICEAVTRANMRFVATKTPQQQSCLMLHRTRHLFIRQQTAVINAIRTHLAEFGIVAPVGRHGVEQLLNVVADPNDKRVPEIARACLAALGAQLRRLKEQVLEFDRMINAWHRSNEMSRRLDEARAFLPEPAGLRQPIGTIEHRNIVSFFVCIFDSCTKWNVFRSVPYRLIEGRQAVRRFVGAASGVVTAGYLAARTRTNRLIDLGGGRRFRLGRS